MILNKYLINNLFQKNPNVVYKISKANIFNRSRIGNRDWVGFGCSGYANYFDEPSWPCPAVRFRENTNELLALREKEKGDWRKLTIDEKKTLYRASFCQTFEEVMAPTGEWKKAAGGVFFCIGMAFWLAFWFSKFIWKEPGPTFAENYRRQSLRRLLDLKFGIFTGISSLWDYEKDDWKK